jgi:hypothetical protein
MVKAIFGLGHPTPFSAHGAKERKKQRVSERICNQSGYKAKHAVRKILSRATGLLAI